jgi:hypothetical protein
MLCLKDIHIGVNNKRLFLKILYQGFASISFYLLRCTSVQLYFIFHTFSLIPPLYHLLFNSFYIKDFSSTSLEQFILISL